MKRCVKTKLLILLLVLSTVISLSGVTAVAAADTEAAPVVAETGLTVADYKAAVVKLVNAEREKAGGTDLTIMDKLSSMADDRAKESASAWSHTRPDGSRCFTIFAEYYLKYKAAGENLARGYNTPEATVQAWMNSELHKENILNPDFEYIGIGFYCDPSGTVYCSQLFYTPIQTNAE